MQEQLPSLVCGPTVHIQDDRSFSNEVLTQALLDSEQHLPQLRRVIVGGDAHDQVDFADAHQLAKKIVREKTFFSQLLRAPWSTSDAEKSLGITPQNQIRRRRNQ
jgi:hypothetical protein